MPTDAVSEPRRRKVESTFERLRGGGAVVFRLAGIRRDDTWFDDVVDEIAQATSRRLRRVAGRSHERERAFGALDGWIRTGSTSDPVDELLASCAESATLLTIRDPHQLDDASATALGSLIERASSVDLAVVMVLPSDRLRVHPALGAIDAVPVDVMSYDDTELHWLAADRLGCEPSDRVLAAVTNRSGGDPVISVALLEGLRQSANRSGEGHFDLDEAAEQIVPDQVLDVVDDRLRWCGRDEVSVIETWALLGDDYQSLASIVDVDRTVLRQAETAAVATGLMGTHGIVPIARQSLLKELDHSRRIELADMLLAGAGERSPVWLAARAESLGNDDRFHPSLAAAAEEIVFDDPHQAARWLEAASSTLNADQRALHATALAACGQGDQALALAEMVLDDPTVTDHSRALLVTGSVFAAAGQLDSAARCYRDTADTPSAAQWHAWLAIPAEVASTSTRLSDPAVAAPNTALGQAAVQFASASRAVRDEVAGGTAGLETATQLLAGRRAVALWPDSPQAFLVMSRVVQARAADAAPWLDEAVSSGLGGPAYVARHELLRGWVGLRTGDWERASAALSAVSSGALPLRDQLTTAALDSALAFRSGNRSLLESTTVTAMAVVRKVPVSVTAFDPQLELARVIGSRAGFGAVSELLDQLGEIADSLPADWQRWYRFMGVLTASQAQADSAVARLGVDATGDDPLDVGARTMAAIHAGSVHEEQVADAAGGLRDRGLISEAAHVTGLGSMRSEDTASAKRLLRLAREIRRSLPSSGATEAEGLGALSDREREVGQLVIDGHTYKEIGAQLFISAKTVEHHVAHIRTKLGASSRAEMLQTLRSGL